jgi:hypothetical protein
MAALTIERLTDFAGVVPARGTYPVAANVKIYKGALVCLNADGRAIPGNTIANGAAVAVGKSSATFDNAGGSAGAFDVEVEFGTYGWDSSDVGIDDVGKLAYVVDDQTVSASSSTGARIAAGVITEWRQGQAFVWMGPHVHALTA